MTIRKARPDEAALLSDLAIRSKAHWPYTDEQLEVFRGELTLGAGDLADGRAFVVEVEGRVSGFYTLEDFAPDEIELGHLFIEPDALGRGLGASLLEHARGVAHRLGYAAMRIQSDPNAAGFYEGAGASKVGDIPTSIPGRTLPCYRLELP